MDISVVIPCYNAAPWVGETIESVLSQAYRPAEVVAVDDGSTDETSAVLSRFAPHVTVVRQANAGLGAARNAGAAAARMPWLAFLDADDLYVPESLSSYRDLHQVFPEAKVLFGDFEEFESGGVRHPQSGLVYLNDIQRFASRSENDGYLLRPPAEVVIARNGAFAPSCLVLQRDLFLDVGGFDHYREKQGAEDLDLYFRLLPDQPIAFLKRVVVRKRRHAANMSNLGDHMRAATFHAIQRAETNYRANHRELLPIVRRKHVGLLKRWTRYDISTGRPTASSLATTLLKEAPFTPEAWWLYARARAAFMRSA